MKIGLVCPLLSYTGGVQRHTLLLGEALAERGVEIVYFSPATPNNSDLPANHVQLGTAVVLPNLNGSWNDYSVTTQSKEELAQQIKDLRIDILHFQALVVPFAAWQLLEASPVINIATLLSGWEKTNPVESVIPIFELLVKNLKSKLVQTIAISQTALRSERYFADDNTLIIPTPMAVARFQATLPRPQALGQGLCHLVFVGRLDKRKGFLELLAAVKALPKSIRHKIKVHIIGAGPQEWRGRHYITLNELTDVVLLHGRLSESEKIAFLQHSDIFVAPSFSGESFGIVLTEAMAAGIPIICGNAIGYRETMKDYPSPQFVIDPQKPRLFARAITELVENPTLRTKLSKWGKEYVKRFDISKVADQHIELYTKLLANR